MVKLIIGILIACVIVAVIRFIWAVLSVLLEYKLWEREFDKRIAGAPKRSSYREAFMLECSDDMVREDPYAKSLDKAIKKLDKAEKKLEDKRKKVAEKLSRMK